MIEVQLSKQSLTKVIVTLYANMIGYFTPSGFAGGVHVGHIKSIEITTKKGKQALSIKTELLTFMNNEEVDEKQLDKGKAWVDKVQRAMQSTAL